MVPTDPHSLAEKYTCDSEKYTCKILYVFRKRMLLLYWCDNGGVSGWLWHVEYYAWAKVDGKVKKVVESVGVEEAIKLVNYNLKTNKIHNSCPLQRKLQR